MRLAPLIRARLGGGQPRLCQLGGGDRAQGGGVGPSSSDPIAKAEQAHGGQGPGDEADGKRPVDAEGAHGGNQRGRGKAVCSEVVAIQRRRKSIHPSSAHCYIWRCGYIQRCALVALLAFASPVSAAVPESYDVSARVREGREWVEGRWRAQVRVARGEEGVRLWVYSARLSAAPSRMDERSWRWIFHGEVDLSDTTIADVRVDGEAARFRTEAGVPGAPRGIDAAGQDLWVAIPPGPARTVRLELAFSYRVPARFGRLGRDDGLLSLAAPWYPLVVDEDAYAFPVRHRVRLRAQDGEVLLAGRRRTAVEQRAPYVPAAVAGRWFTSTFVAGRTRVRMLTPHVPYRPPAANVRGEQGLLDLSRIDVVGLTEEVVQGALRGARAFGVPVPDELTMVQIPSRTELCATAPGQLLFSDRLFQIFPLDQVLDFHRGALLRAVFRALAEPLSERADPPADAGWAADVRAAALTDLDRLRRHHGAQTPQQLLGILAFHPAVDQLLYAPQIAFEDAYFSTIEERDPFRDDPVRARRPLSRGRRILESARDALNPDAFQRLVAMWVNAKRSARAALHRASRAHESRLEGWLAATGVGVNYRLGSIRSEPLPGGRFRHHVEVIREGGQRVEAVEVRLSDEAGEVLEGAWDGRASRGEVVFESGAPYSDVQLDPRHRLPQSPALTPGHPRADDGTSLPFRPPILNGFLLNIFVSEGDFTGLVDFALRRKYDLDHTIGLRLERTRAFTGGELRYAYGIGPMAHTNRKIGLLSAGASISRLHQFFGEGDLGGWRAQLSAGASVNTTRFSLDPRSAVWGSARLVGGVALRDDFSVGATFRGRFRIGVVLPLGLVNGLVFVAGGGFTAGNALRSELQTLGGGGGLRGFESAELLGRGVVFGVAEHRWNLFRDLAINVLNLVWIREIQLAAFVGAGSVFDAVDGQGAVFGMDAGGGLRIHHEYGGVQPGVVSIDVGVPISRDDDRVFADGRVVRQRNAVGFYIGFDQYF